MSINNEAPIGQGEPLEYRDVPSPEELLKLYGLQTATDEQIQRFLKDILEAGEEENENEDWDLEEEE
jgi:hypothetical protein